MDNALADLFSKLAIKPAANSTERNQFLTGIRNHLREYPGRTLLQLTLTIRL